MSESAGGNEASSKALLAKTARGTAWVVSWRMATRFLGLISTLCLVRLLAPADFGLVTLGVSMATAVDGLAEIGIQDALVRDRAPDRQVYNTAFTLAVLRGAITSLAIVLGAAPMARFFGDKRLEYVLFALAFAVLADAATNIGIVDFRRNFAFDKEFKLRVVPRLVGIVVANGAAWIWHSYWALIASILIGRLLSVAASYAMHPFRPRPTLRAWRALIGYSSWTWTISLLALFRDRVDSFAVGRILGPASVGIYAVGAEIAALPTTELIEPLCRAAFSGFAEGRRTGASAGQTYLRVVGAATLLTMPAGIGIALVADPLVRVAFGANWLAAVPVVRILGGAGIVAVFGYIGMILLSAHGRLKLVFRAGVTGLCIRLGLLIAIAPRFGLSGIAAASALGMAVEQGVLTWTALRDGGLRSGDLMNHIWRPALAGAAMAGVLLKSGLLMERGAAEPAAIGPDLLLPALVGAGIYVAALIALWGLCGRPAGAEQDLMALIARAAQPARRWVRIPRLKRS